MDEIKIGFVLESNSIFLFKNEKVFYVCKEQFKSNVISPLHN